MIMNYYEMSADKTTIEATDTCCASCGITELDDVELKPCDDCDLVKYCSGKCKEDHLPQHEAKCKERAAELRDELLFRQPESSHLGDCPICCLPLPIDPRKSVSNTCCSKSICRGCSYANDLRQKRENIQVQTCPFCRHPVPHTMEEVKKNVMKRIEVNDPVALSQMGNAHWTEGDYEGAFKYYTKSAELGDAGAHYDLAIMYRDGQSVEKDEKKELYHLKEAAMAGHPHARFNLASKEGRNGRIERAVKHFIIAANLGLDDAMKFLKEYYKRGYIEKDDFAAALRAHHAAVKATKSPQRDVALRAYAAREM